MEIIRADEQVVYLKNQIQNHSTCFIVIQGEQRDYYAFEIISDKEAILYMTNPDWIKEVIDEFLFYSGFIAEIRNENGDILYQSRPKKKWIVKLNCIQPSQLYVSEEKFNRLLTWIKKEEDVIIPVTILDGKLVALDGHTRLKVAEYLKFEQVTVYLDEADIYIQDFVDFCRRENKEKIQDLPIVEKEIYQVLWNDFCKNYFKNH